MIMFVFPLALFGLLALPLLWYLLRIFPPMPRLVTLPGAWLLNGLTADKPTIRNTPWWMLLLRILIAAMLIIALAQPVVNPAQSLVTQGPVRLVLDNGWAASQTWSLQIRAAMELVDRAARDKREITILTLAPNPGQASVTQQGPMVAAQAESILKGLQPRPWPADYKSALNTIEKNRPSKPTHSYWLGHGTQDGEGSTNLARALQAQGGLSYQEPAPAQWPLLLLQKFRAGQSPELLIQAPRGIANGRPVSIEAISRDGRVLERKDISLNKDDLPHSVTFELPDALRGQIGQFRLGGAHGAGGMILVDDQFAQRRVGLVRAQTDGQSTKLTDVSYYITRALEPHADILGGDLTRLLNEPGLGVIILPDIGALPPESWTALETWVRKGGLLLRFAGPAMSQADNFLTPTPLRKGGRALDGSLTWDKPQGINPFPSNSPLYGLTIPPDIIVNQQILAEPVTNMEQKVWATLTDGTPLITADGLDRGLIILVHTTATPDWSNLSLSGLYVQMLQRFIMLSGSSDAIRTANGALQPVKVLDGMGRLQTPDSTVQPIDSAGFDTTQPDSVHPPGIYGQGAMRRVMNIGDRIQFIHPMPTLPSGVERITYEQNAQEKNLMPLFLIIALGLFIIDWIIMLVLHGVGTGRLRFGVLSILAFLTLLSPASGYAAQIDAKMIAYASQTHLAYIPSGNPEIDGVTQKGLENLLVALDQRTSINPAGIVALDPERDDLSFFPLIYWPVTAQQTRLSEKALNNIQFYLDHGGTILFDTRDSGTSGTSRTSLALQALTAGLNVAPLIIAPKDHVLTKSFYLLKTFPGRYDNATIWIEEQSASGRDGVSTILVGGNDWAAAWAGVSPAVGSREHEMALRFGVNIMMYALTGNYKADQVHVPHILQRLGR